MAINVEQDKNLALMQREVLKIRTVLKGAPFVKMADQELLPSPNEVDTTSKQALSQYAKYKAGAEFDEYTSQTLTSMIGKLNLDDNGQSIISRITSEPGDYRIYYQNVYDAIANGAPLNVTPKQARQVIELLELANMSAHQERRIKL